MPGFWDKLWGYAKKGWGWLVGHAEDAAKAAFEAAKDLFFDLRGMSWEALQAHWQAYQMEIYPAVLSGIIGQLVEPLKNIAGKITGQLDQWGITPPASWRNWLDVSVDLPDFIKGILGKYRKTARPQDIAAGAGHAYATHRLSSEIVHESIMSIAYKDIAASEEIVKYVSELHEAHIEAPPVTPPNMPDIPNIVFNPPGHPWFKEWIGLEKVQESIEGVWHGIMTIMSRVKDIFIGLYNWIMETLTKSINVIITGISNVGTYIATGVTQLAGVIWDSVREGASWVVSGLQNIWGAMTTWIQSVVMWIWQVIQGAYTWVLETAKSMFEYLSNLIKPAFQWVRDEIILLGTNLFNSIGWVKDKLVLLYEVIRDAILVDFPNMLAVLGSKIASLADDMPGVLKDAGIYILKYIGNVIVFYIKAAFYVGGHVYKFLKEIFQWISAQITEHVIPFLKEKLGPQIEKVKDLGDSTKEFITREIMKYKEIKPEQVPEFAGKVLGAAVGFGLAAHTISVVCELLHPLKEIGVHYMAGFLSDMGGFGIIATAIMGTLVYTAIRQPYQYLMNQHFRPTIPDENLLNAMMAKREITPEQFKQYMRYHGYPEHLLDALLRYLWMDPRLFEVIRIAEISSPPEQVPPDAAWWLAKANIEPKDMEDWWYYLKFAKAGYDPIDLPVLADASRFAVKRREQTMFLMRVRTAYREGLMDGETAFKFLKEAGLRDDVAGFRMRSMIEEYRQKTAGYIKTEYTHKFRNDLITEDVFLSGLLYAGFLDNRAGQIIYMEKLRKQTRVTQKVEKEQEKVNTEFQRAQFKLYREQFRKGLIDADSFENNLTIIGLLPEMAAITVEIEVAGMYEDPEVTRQKEAAALMKKIQKERIAKYKLMFRAQMLSKIQLYAYLVAAGMDATYAYAVTNTEEARMFAPPKPELES